VDVPAVVPGVSDRVAEASVSDSSEQEAVQQLLRNFGRVHFAVDRSTLEADAVAALDENAEILQRHVGIRIEVQGHADDRGTVDYNLALGQRRADAVARRLAHMGVHPTRLATVSFGEEQPRAAGTGESVWSENRRAEFRILTGSGARGTVE
jgi:peptidoglycan-associated lipoprotein